MKSINLIFFILLFFIINTFSTKASHQKPDKKRNFIESNSELTLFCETPCQFKKRILKKVLQRLTQDLTYFEERLGNPIPQRLKPIEVHINFDSVCQKVLPNVLTPEALGIKEGVIMGFTSQKLDGKSLLCLKSEPADILIPEGDGRFLHELAHHYFKIVRNYEEMKFEEDLVNAIIGFANGRQKTLCSEDYAKHEPRIFRLCQEEGFDTKHIPAFLRRVLEIEKPGLRLKNLLKETVTTFPPNQ